MIISYHISFAAALDVTQFAEQVRMKLISQLINGISGVLQKLLKYFNFTIISSSFIKSAPVSPVIFCLNLNEALAPGKLLIIPLFFIYEIPKLQSNYKQENKIIN